MRDPFFFFKLLGSVGACFPLGQGLKVDSVRLPRLVRGNGMHGELFTAVFMNGGVSCCICKWVPTH
jgi:hypothetical protein